MKPGLVLTRAAALVVLAAGAYAGARPLGPVPPLGPLLDPVHGVWAVARRAELPANAAARIPGLTAPVDVRYDDRAVPHIFAATVDDAYRALGYVVARDRLFQLEIQTRATAGTLTELVGAAGLRFDREQRRLGLARSAHRALASLPAGSRSARALAAYADGVNAWIDGLAPADLPIEYRLLDARPARWEPVHTLYLLRRMSWTLTYGNDEFRRERVAALVGGAAADALFPVNSPIQEPIVPGAGAYPRYDWRRLPPPARAALRSEGLPIPHPHPQPLASGGGAGGGEGIGSNNWAVAPSRSATGHALLAGDPHLDLTLPSIWYEVHLVVPPSAADSGLDVYGVTIPGAPAVVIGFNRDVAWSLTNTEADVLDYWRERVDDPAAPARHRVDGAWLPLESVVERYRDRTGAVLAADTLRFSYRGPLVRRGDEWLSLRWTALETAAELDAVLGSPAARTADQWLAAQAGWEAAAQNMLAADRRGTIAIRSTGRFPLRAGSGSGLEIRDGTTRRSDWPGDWPPARHPSARNPARGFLSSANQQPLDPRQDPTYLGVNWAAPWRALRINRFLRADSAVTVDDMRRWQTDPGSERAGEFFPYFLTAAGLDAQACGRVSGRFPLPVQSPPDSVVAAAARLLADWDCRYPTEDTRAVLFEAAMDRLTGLVWDELEDATGRRVATPRDVVLAELLRQPASPWWDRRETPGLREDRDVLLRRSLALALEDVTRRYGPPGERWRWGAVEPASINHLLGILAFSARGLPVAGGPGSLNPSAGGSNGASWRMVVELGEEVRGWGTYPGGQSGNPASRRYLDRLPRWVAGELDSLRVPRTAVQLVDNALTARLVLTPATSP